MWQNAATDTTVAVQDLLPGSVLQYYDFQAAAPPAHSRCAVFRVDVHLHDTVLLDFPRPDICIPVMGRGVSQNARKAHLFRYFCRCTLRAARIGSDAAACGSLPGLRHVRCPCGIRPVAGGVVRIRSGTFSDPVRDWICER